MRSFLITIVIYILLFAGPDALAQKGISKDDFLGLPWNSTISDYSKLKDPSPEVMNSNPSASLYDRYTNLTEVGGEKVRIGMRELHKIGEVEVGTTDYYFKDNKFYMAVTRFEGLRRYRVLEEALILKYGRPDEKRHQTRTWRNRPIWVHIEYDDFKGTGFLQYIYGPSIYEEMKQEKRDAERTRDNL